MTLSRTSNRAHFALLSLAAVVAVLFALVLSPSRALAETISVNPGSLTSHTCDSTEWHFVITGLGDPNDAPASIHVTWANGASADVPLDNVTGGTAHYRTTSNLDSTVTGATAEIFAEFNTFNLSHGPCGATVNTPTTVPPTEVPATETPTQVAVTEVPTETPPVSVTETIGGEEETPIPTNTPAAGVTETPATGVTETVGGEEETPAATEVPVGELPSTGSAPGSGGSSGILVAALLAAALAGAGLVLRHRSIGAGR